MKYINTLLYIACIQLLIAQYDGKDSLIASRFRPGVMWFNTGWRPAKIGRPRKYDRLIIDMNFTMWQSKPAFHTPLKGSVGWSAHAMWDIPLTNGNTVSLGWGFSYRHQRVGLTGPLLMDSAQTSTTYFPNAVVTPLYSKSVFGMHLLALPIELRFRMEKWRHVKLHIGGSVGYCLQSYQKTWYNGQNEHVKMVNALDVTPWIFAAHARFGIRNWAVFANYNFVHQFTLKQSSRLTPFTFGIALSVF